MAKQVEWVCGKNLPMVLPLVTFLGSLPSSWNVTEALSATVAASQAFSGQVACSLRTNVSAVVVRSQIGLGGSSLEYKTQQRLYCSGCRSQVGSGNAGL